MKLLKIYKVIKDCYCEHYLHELTNYNRPGLVEKSLKENDIVELYEEWSNCYGKYFTVIKDDIKYDILPKYLKLIDKKIVN